MVYACVLTTTMLELESNWVKEIWLSFLFLIAVVAQIIDILELRDLLGLTLIDPSS